MPLMRSWLDKGNRVLDTMRAALPLCEAGLKECHTVKDTEECVQALMLCWRSQILPYAMYTNLNPYDVRDLAPNSGPEGIAYKTVQHLGIAYPSMSAATGSSTCPHGSSD